jgi:subtilase family serine protease
MAKLHTLPLCVLASALLGIGVSSAQSNRTVITPSNRIVSPVDDTQLVTLHGTVSPLATQRNDLGAAPDGLQLERMHLVLKRSDSQEAALKQLIDEMHTPGSPNYHQWLTPDQFGAQFGPSDQDISAVTTWLTNHGFNVKGVNPGRQTIEISGSVAQLRNAFHTQIHQFTLNGQTHYSNTSDPQIPAALAPVVGGFVSLNNFPLRSYAHSLGKAQYNPTTNQATPNWTTGSPGALSFVLAPVDYAVQYDLNPLYTAGVNGSGQTIAIINESNINVNLVNQYRTLFNLPANPPQVIIDGNDPGVDGINNPGGPNFASLEAYLDVEWAGTVAPNATIDLVVAADTAMQSGLILAAERAVYSNLAPVISLSFGACEVDLGSSNAFMSSLWEQAAAQGSTVLVSTGDSGSAGCDDDNSQSYAVGGQAVNGNASTPYNVAVGGTDFFYSQYAAGGTALTTQIGTYWNMTPSNSTPAVSLLQPIPEQPWNESQYGLNINSYYTQFGTTSIAGAGGGASNAALCSGNTYSATTGLCTSSVSGYPKPTWQTGVAGIPADNVRDIPDVSLFASSGINASFYPVCASDGDCQPVSPGGTVQITGVGGTSASTPAFAGIMALVNQKYGRQGQANTVLYPLAAQFPASFHDVTNGSNSVPCEYLPILSTNCIAVSSPIVLSTLTPPVTLGQIGSGTTAEYNAGVGYDLASGLGTVDAAVLVNNWNKVTLAATTTTMTPTPANSVPLNAIPHGTSVTIAGTVTGSGTPTGQVALMTDGTQQSQQGLTNFTLASGSYTGTTLILPGGTYNIWAQYGGDSVNGMSTSGKTQITVTPEASTINLNMVNSITNALYKPGSGPTASVD